MKKVFMIHGFEGSPNGGWRPWLMRELQKKEIYACSLPMPSPALPKKDEWIKEISHAVGKPTEDVFLIGHSLGTPAILSYLESLNEGDYIGGAVLVAGPYKNNQPHNKLSSFFENSYDFEKIKKGCKKFVIIHGDNDFVVSLDQPKYISEKLSCEIIWVKNGGHLNGESGWYELPEALEVLEKMINK